MTGVAYPVSALTPASVPVLLILRKFTCCALPMASRAASSQQDQEEPHLTQSAALVTQKTQS